MDGLSCLVRIVTLAGAVVATAATHTMVAAQESQTRLAITNVRIFTGERPIEKATITVESGKIAGISADVLPSAHSRTIDGNGMTALPGLIDAHVHLQAGMDEARALTFVEDGLQDTLRAFVRHGVTTVESLADPTELTLQTRRKLREGALVGPRLLGVGMAFTAPGGHPNVTFCRGNARCAFKTDSEEEARGEARQLAHSGVDAIKLVNQGGEILGIRIAKLKPEVMRAIVAEAHAQRLRVIAHIGNESDALEALAAGVDSLSHMPAGGLSSNALAQALVNTERVVMTTLAARTRRGGAKSQASQTLTELHRAGVQVVMGSDSGPVPSGFPRSALLPGESTLEEIEVLVELGLTPEEALKAATSVAARHLGLEHEIGKLEPGMAADILLVQGNPLQTISDLRRVKVVIQAGKVVFQASN